jgi:dihydroflavonol-4-reductase
MASGRSGQRYILGGHNMHYRDFMELVSEVTGAPRVKRAVPPWLARVVGLGGDVYEKVSGREPLLNSATIRWGQEARFIASSEKAMDELGYRISPLETAIKDAVSWFREHEML